MLEEVAEEPDEFLSLARRARLPVTREAALGDLREVEDLVRDRADPPPPLGGLRLLLEAGVGENPQHELDRPAKLVGGRPRRRVTRERQRQDGDESDLHEAPRHRSPPERASARSDSSTRLPSRRARARGITGLVPSKEGADRARPDGAQPPPPARAPSGGSGARATARARRSRAPGRRGAPRRRAPPRGTRPPGARRRCP